MLCTFSTTFPAPYVTRSQSPTTLPFVVLWSAASRLCTNGNAMTCQRLIADVTLYVCEANSSFRLSDRKSKIMETLEVKSRSGTQLEPRDDKGRLWNGIHVRSLWGECQRNTGCLARVAVGTCVLSTVYWGGRRVILTAVSDLVMNCVQPCDQTVMDPRKINCNLNCGFFVELLSSTDFLP